MQRLLRPAALFLALLSVLGAGECFLLPALYAWRDIEDPAMSGPGIPERALDLHRSLSERIEPWARDRIASGEAAWAPLHDVPTTEWPIFTSVFYLNATQQLADQGVDVAYARPSVEAARDLIMDPVHHTWVRTHWGNDYLHDENVFFRSLLISGLTSYIALTHDERDMDFLRDQVETLATDLDRSPHGVLQDYPGETYPIDVLASIAWIRRADRVLGTDHSEFVARARRAFVAPYDDELGLPRFRVDLQGAAMPVNVQPGRGIGTSWILIFAPELWPEDAERWYATHEAEFWQELDWATGFREYAFGTQDEWTYDVDAGPVLDGFGTAASAFGVGAARANGRFDHAAALSSQMSAVAWPWHDGSMLFPQQFSHPCAPMLGEAAITYFLTIPPAEGVSVTHGEPAITALVLFAFAIYLGAFLLVLVVAWRAARRVRGESFAGRRTRTLVFAALGALAVLASLVDPFVAVAACTLACCVVPGKPRRSAQPPR